MSTGFDEHLSEAEKLLQRLARPSSFPNSMEARVQDLTTAVMALAHAQLATAKRMP